MYYIMREKNAGEADNMYNKLLEYDMEDIFSRNVDWNLLDKKSILLTGAYGMLASYIVYFLLYIKKKKKIDVKLIVVVRNKKKFYDKFCMSETIEDVQVIQSDLSSSLKIDDSVDYIIHAASLASPQYYGICPVDVLKPNTIGNYYMLELAKEKKVEGYLLFSTCDIYGSPEKDIELISEINYGSMDTLDIHNCYSESKRMAETMCKAYQVQYQIPIKIVRIAHTYAPTMDIHNDPRVFASFVNNIVQGQNIIMKSDGTGKRSFCYITDAVAGYFKVLFDGVTGEAYNVCNTSQFVSIRELAEKLVALVPEKKLTVIMKTRDKSENYTENTLLLGHESVPDNTKLQKLGWEAKVDITEGFSRVVRYITNLDA